MASEYQANEKKKSTPDLLLALADDLSFRKLHFSFRWLSPEISEYGADFLASTLVHNIEFIPGVKKSWCNESLYCVLLEVQNLESIKAEHKGWRDCTQSKDDRWDMLSIETFSGISPDSSKECLDTFFVKSNVVWCESSWLQ